MIDAFKIAVFGSDEKNLLPEITSLGCKLDFYGYEIDLLMEPLKEVPSVILCYAGKSDFPPAEIAQNLRMNYPQTPIFFLTLDKKDFDKKKLIKNGFTNAYLIPWETSDLLMSLKEEAVYSTLPELRNYVPVKVVDLIPGVVLDFSLKAFLPLNNKIIPFSSEGLPIDEAKIKKLDENRFNTLFIHKEEIEKFREYTVQVLSKYLKPNQMSETDRQEKLKTCVRDLISDIFFEDAQENTFGNSQALLKEVKEVIALLMSEAHSDMMKKINSLINAEKNFYSHLSNVSTFAGVFGMILEMENPEQLALAGILHDIGKINLPQEFAGIEEADLSPHALEAFKKHPQYSIDVIKLKRIPLPDKVLSAISQHHEAMNGQGYPLGLEGHRITKEARVLAIANTFDNLTTTRPGHKALSLHEAMLTLLEENSKDPGKTLLDMEMLRKLKAFLIK